MMCIDDGDDGIEFCSCLDIVVYEEGLCYWGRVGDFGCFYDDGVECVFLFYEILDGLDEIFVNGVVDVVVVYFKNFFVGFYQQVVVDVYFIEFVDDYGIMLVVIFV